MASIETVKKWMKAIYGNIVPTIIDIKNENAFCNGCRNSKVIITKNGQTIEYTYDENGKETKEIKNEH
jgi:hypothetical protein